MSKDETPAGLPPTENFECCWCKQPEVWSAERNEREPDPSVYTYEPDWYGGWCSESKLPICDGCADAAQEEMDAEQRSAI